MDDENLKEQQNTEEQKVQQEQQEKIDDATNGIKDTTNLVKSAMTANPIGVVKSGANLLKNKSFRRAILKKAILKILKPLLIILLVAAIFLGVFNAVGNVINELLSGASGAVDAIKDFFGINNEDGSIEVTDESVDTVLNSISSMGISLQDLHLLGEYEEEASEEERQEAARIYIRKFFEAQVVTETLNYNKGQSGDKTYGAVYVYRVDDEESTTDQNKQQLTYMPYEELQAYTTRTDVGAAEEARRYFSIDDSGNLVYVSTGITTVERGESTGDLSQESQTVTISLRTLNYKSAITQYTTQMNFLIYLTMVSQNPEFVSAVTDLIKDSRIEITIMDSVSTNVNTETYTYVEYTRSEYDYEDEDGTQHTGYETTSENKIEITRTTTVTYSPVVKVTYAKTWFSEQTIEYNRVTREPVIVNSVSSAENDESLADEERLTGDETGTWIENQVKNYNDTTTSIVYEEGVKGEVDYSRLGQQGDAERYKNGEITEPTFIGLMETEFRIPYSTRTDVAGSNLTSGAEILFFLLQNDSKLEPMEEIMRYALYLYSGGERDYGVTELDGSLFEIGGFTSVTGIYGSNAEEMVWFALRNAGYSEIATAAVMGNIANESGFDPAKIEGGTGIGLGLCQWSYGRRDALEGYIASKGTDTSDVKTQIEFLLAELTPGGGADGFASYQMGSASSSKYDGNRYICNDWKNAEDIETATIAFMAIFERPSYDPDINHIDRRINDAQAYYEEFQGREAPTSDIRIGEINLSGDNYTKMANMLSEAVRICDDDRYTYSQANRFGEFQYDCSSLVYRLYQEFFGILVPTTTKGYSTSSPYCVGPIGVVELQPGDVLWRSGHVELYIGNGLTAGAKSGKSAIPDQIKISDLDLSNFVYVYRFIT